MTTSDWIKVLFAIVVCVVPVTLSTVAFTKTSIPQSMRIVIGINLGLCVFAMIATFAIQPMLYVSILLWFQTVIYAGIALT